MLPRYRLLRKGLINPPASTYAMGNDAGSYFIHNRFFPQLSCFFARNREIVLPHLIGS